MSMYALASRGSSRSCHIITLVADGEVAIGSVDVTKLLRDNRLSVKRMSYVSHFLFPVCLNIATVMSGGTIPAST